MAFIEVTCVLCKHNKIRKHGKLPNGTQRYIYLNDKCSKKTFVLQYRQGGKDPEVKKQIIEMAMNGSGIRDTSRVLKISQNTVMNEIKKNRDICRK
jgi:transposase-like protein